MIAKLFVFIVIVLGVFALYAWLEMSMQRRTVEVEWFDDISRCRNLEDGRTIECD